MRTVAFIPYFGGEGPKAPSPSGKRPEYFRKTVNSLHDFADDIWVGVCQAEDYAPIRGISYLKTVLLDCEPHEIPLELVKFGQEDGVLTKADFVYVTEADQIMHLDIDLLAEVHGNDYLVPHRLEQLGPNDQGADRGPVVEHDNRQFVLANGWPQGPPPLYHPETWGFGYGGAFLSTADFFRSLRFNLHPDFCVENITGRTAYFAGNGYKSSDWRKFFVEHLSGYDYHCKL
jgi:hypothetical protein